MSLAALLTHSATPQRHTPVVGVAGGINKVWNNICPAVALRRQDAKSEIKRRYASDNIIVTHTIFTEYAGMQIGDRFNTDDNLYWMIRGIRERSQIGGMDTFYVYDCEQIKVRAE